MEQNLKAFTTIRDTGINRGGERINDDANLKSTAQWLLFVSVHASTLIPAG